MSEKNQFTPKLIFPVAVIVLSVINIFTHAEGLISLSVLLSFVGIAGAVFYFLRKPFATKLIYVWIIAQIVVIDPFFDLSQGFRFDSDSPLRVAMGKWA